MHKKRKKCEKVEDMRKNQIAWKLYCIKWFHHCFSSKRLIFFFFKIFLCGFYSILVFERGCYGLVIVLIFFFHFVNFFCFMGFDNLCGFLSFGCVVCILSSNIDFLFLFWDFCLFLVLCSFPILNVGVVVY